MKTRLLIITSILFFHSFLFSQQKKPVLTVLNVDVKGIGLDPESAGNLLRREVEKIDSFDVTDRYDVAYLIEKNNIKVTNCYGKTCLVEVGRILKSDKMLTGSIELYADMIVVSIRLIDAGMGSVEKTIVKEFLNNPKEIQSMITITVREMFKLKNDAMLVESLTKKHTFPNAINNPNKNRLALDGPRMGFTVLTGLNSEIFRSSEEVGGFDGFPAMFQFGYQFEKQYLNEGNFQALFEFVPMITGLDQGLFIPSMTIMHGLRSNKNGWEFAFGPTLGLVQKADGYYDPDLGWQLKTQWNDTLPNPHAIVSRMDSRGELTISSGFVFAFGKSIKSGRLNIPFNAYVIPQKHGWRFGLSFGFNSKVNEYVPKK